MKNRNITTIPRLNQLFRSRRVVIVALFVSLLFSMWVFAYSVQMRSPWFGTVGMGRHQWLTGASLKYVNNWLKEDPVSLRFALLETPKSVETPDIEKRRLYNSYPPGAFLPVYALHVLAGKHTASPKIIMAYNLSTQYLTALILSVTIFLLARFGLRMSWGSSTLASIAPYFLYIFTPSGFYWFQNSYFSDQAVMLWVGLFIGVEAVSVLIRHSFINRRLRWAIFGLRYLVIFMGVITEWYFIFLIAFYLLFRFAETMLFSNEKIPKLRQATIETCSLSVTYLPPLLLAIFAFILQVNALNGWDELIGKFRARSGLQIINVPRKSLNELIWLDYTRLGFGRLAPILLIIGLAALGFITYRLLRSRRQAVALPVRFMLTISWALVVSTIAKLYFFKGHTPYHEFTMLLWGIPFAFVLFGTLPILIATQTRLREFIFRIDLAQSRVILGKVSISAVIVFTVFIATVYSVTVIKPSLYALFPPNDVPFGDYTDLIRTNTDYDDIVFSPDFIIERDPPQLSVRSQKLVYPIEGNVYSDVLEKFGYVTEDFDIVIVTDKRANRSPVINADLSDIRSSAFYRTETDHYLLIKIEWETFRRLAKAGQ